MTIWAIVPAAGIGQRMASDTPKQYLPLGGKAVMQHSLEKLLAIPSIATVVVALHPRDTHFDTLQMNDDRIETVAGGSERQQSVLNGLKSLEGRAIDTDWVLVHDAVRPCVLIEDIEKLLGAISVHEVGGLLAAPQDNTLKRRDTDGHVEATVSREQIWQAYTPQVFRFGLLRKALLTSQHGQQPITDEASAVESMGLKPLLVESDRNNIKITRSADLQLAGLILQSQESRQ